MAYDQTSFLQGIVVGRSMKGWACGQGTAVPTVWNDTGHYDYLYIDYHLPITSISLSLFRLCTRIMCESGEIEISGITSYTGTTFKVYCDLTQANGGWVAAVGYNSSWLEYDSGVKVPEYASLFWVDSKQPWTPGYLEDTGAVPTWLAKTGTDTYEITHRAQTLYTINESTGKIAWAVTGTETLTITYS